MAYHERKYEWTYVYCFVEPRSGASHWLILPTVTLEAMHLALKDFAETVNPDKSKIIMLLIDNAGFHQLAKTNIPEGILFCPLPAYTPELQPVETVWPLLKEVVANTFFKNINLLEDVIAERCNWLSDNLEAVKNVAGFQWIIDLSCNTT